MTNAFSDLAHYTATYQFIPLTVFLVLSRISSYPAAFIMSGTLALLHMIIQIWLNPNSLDRLFAGANLFLIVGAVGFLLHILNINHTLVSLYGKYTYTMFFAGIILVGIISLFTSQGFFNLKASAWYSQLPYSIFMLALIGIIIIVQMWLRNMGLLNYLYISTIVGFITLKVLYKILRNKS